MAKVKPIKIKRQAIGKGQKVFIIAEAGVNHNGDVRTAKRLIDAAKYSGADAIKFQTFSADRLVTRTAAQASYQKKNAGAKTQYKMLKNLELNHEQFKQLFAHAKKKGILLLSTPFDEESAEFLHSMKMPLFKIGSGDLNNSGLIKYIAKFKRPIILSTGMANLKEVEQALMEIFKSGNKKVVLLHCTSNYPTAFKDVNLKAMQTLKDKFNVNVGYSDHTLGCEVSLAAVAQGACVIEKHITLDKGMKGPDHKASLDIDELKVFVKGIRNVEQALGSGIKRATKSEHAVKKVARRSLVALEDIEKGERITKSKLGAKRPGTGISPCDIGKIIARRTSRTIKKDQLITWDHVGRVK